MWACRVTPSITTPEGRQILIDGGPTPTDLTWRLGQEMPFWDHSLDAAMHSPRRRPSGRLAVLSDRYTVGQVGDGYWHKQWIVPGVGKPTGPNRLEAGGGAGR